MPRPSCFTIKGILGKKLQDWRRRTSIHLKKSPTTILTNRILMKIVECHPLKLKSLKLVPGMTSKKCKIYGKEILNIILEVSTVGARKG